MTPATAHNLLVTVGIGVVLSVIPVHAAAGPARSFHQLATSLKEGDAVELTEVSGRRTKGRLAQLSACSIVVTTGVNQRVAFERERVRKIRRLRQATGDASASGPAVTANCDRIECTPVTLAILGAASLAHGINTLFNPAKTVYRAPKGGEEPGACQPADAETHKPDAGGMLGAGPPLQPSSERRTSRTVW